MDIKGQIRQILRRREREVLLRSDLNVLGSRSQVSVALKALLDQGHLKRIARGIYTTPGALALEGKQVLLHRASIKTKPKRSKFGKANRTTTTKRYVKNLAEREGVVFHATFADRWANAVTRLAGDNVKSDSTDDLLVALTRADKLSPSEMAKLVMAHHRDAKRV